ncbi:uncharacterized protein si:ch211-113e8.11 [Carcharodon carcharias]|uniref:uncharacterized protein si:ch211-113e8.11 n=1 Tax=Carcharodon carcharias TaxID=13397 RepID=UPI001B7DFB8D|nr:uncharacterized protein si:ch211-113e8.11 [Carcharodon carcharias]
MAALVADYGSSESEGEAERQSGTEPGSSKPRSPGSAASRLKELPAGESGSKEERGEGSVQGKPTWEPQEASALKLPPPELEAGRGHVGVFANPFARERHERLSLLEKHVRLTAPVRTEEDGGRKICLAYRKDGRCRYGSNCKFAHDSDLPTYNPESGAPRPLAGSRPQENGGGGEEPKPRSGKKRPGLGPTLNPPKRSLKNYQAQRAKEGPGLL